MAKRVSFDFSFWGFNSAKKTVADAEREVRIFFKAGCTPSDLLDDVNAFYGMPRNGHEAYRLFTHAKGAPVALAIEDFSGCHMPIASALARSGNLKVLKHAVLRGASIGIERAAKEGAPAIVSAVESCFSRDDDARLPNRDTLRRGFYADVIPMLQFLIEQGADINATDDEGCTALMHAAKVGHQPAVKLLLECGAQIWRQDRHGYDALHLAAVAPQQGSAGRDGYCDVVGTVRTLLENGANPKERNFLGHTVLHTMAVRGEDRTRAEFDPIVRMLLDAGADIEAEDRHGVTPLLMAMRNDGAARVLVSGFVEAGAKTEARTPQGSGAGRLGSAEAKRVLKAAMLAKKIDGAMDDDDAGEQSSRPASAKRESFGML